MTSTFLEYLPDRWGKPLMKRGKVIMTREQGLKVRALRPWDYLIGGIDAYG
ncbi:hypothetical protein [Xanthomonas hortorum]|uniref:hypothetical protein n=1 Tax=Xanthomonas hortorum TaxID=56454 RepID=UPI001592DE06|nr:hypothetical protein [Xanthomonas hortorum]